MIKSIVVLQSETFMKGRGGGRLLSKSQTVDSKSGDKKVKKLGSSSQGGRAGRLRNIEESITTQDQRSDGQEKQHSRVGEGRLDSIEKIVTRLKEVVRNTEAGTYQQIGETSKDQESPIVR